MKTIKLLLIAILFLTSCKKNKQKPKEPCPEPIVCETKSSGNFTSKYYHTFDNPPYPAFTDTIEIKFQKGDCNGTQYSIKNLYQAYADLGIEIQDRIYYITVNENTGIGSINDTMTIKFTNGVLISMKSQGVYVNLSFQK